MSSFNKRTIRDINLTGKRVLLRADYNVSVKNGRVVDDYRLRASLPTINYILDKKPEALIIISHLGRPEGKPDAAMSLRPVARRLQSLLNKRVFFINDSVGPHVQQATALLKKSQIALLENVRFYPGEEANDPKYAQELVKATGADVFVQDCFGVIHRKHASIAAICKLLPAVAGILLEREVETITRIMSSPDKPLVSVIGGAKIADKIQVLEKLISISDVVAIGGAMANTFLYAQGYKIGSSHFDADDKQLARRIMAMADEAAASRTFSLLLPTDVVVSTDINGRKPTRVVDLRADNLADIESYPRLPRSKQYVVQPSELILDIGPTSAAMIAGAIKLAKTVIWNGTLGVTETAGIAGTRPPFAHATDTIVDSMIGESRHHKHKPFTLVGGGDTVGFLESQNIIKAFSFVSTGGGATLELMAGHKLPGLEALPAK